MSNSPQAWQGTNHKAVNAEVAKRCNLKQSTVERVLREHQHLIAGIRSVASRRNQERERWEYEVTGVVPGITEDPPK